MSGSKGIFKSFSCIQHSAVPEEVCLPIAQEWLQVEGVMYVHENSVDKGTNIWLKPDRFKGERLAHGSDGHCSSLAN